MNGKLGTAVIAVADTPTVVYTVPEAVRYSEVHISVLNPNTSVDAAIVLAISTESSYSAADTIENGALIPQGGGVLERDEILGPGEKVFVQSPVTGLVVRVSGKEVA